VPKVVDHDERRELLADALWRVVRRDGFAAVSVRSVAAEAGWSTGSLRYYFSTQDELVTFAMESLLQRVRTRIEAAGRTVRDMDGAVALLEEALPMDSHRRAESEVWLAMASASRTDPRLRQLADQAHRGLRTLCEGVVRLVVALEGAQSRPGLDLQRETDRLHALLDGLAVHGTMHPRQLPRARISAALRAHVLDLAGYRSTF
jgi:DNA-binding transcriptional regulator YbjK